ncbi:MAG: hypothetical protein ACT4TC_17835, partial [Myxococcaceae bacterium]
MNRARRSRDFYAELIHSSQSQRTAILAERERWLRCLSIDGREELLFELEMLLRGVERYFSLHNLPLGPNDQAVTREFRPELTDVRDVLSRAVLIARQMLDQGEDQKMVFRRYLETQVSDDRERRRLLEAELNQDSPLASLFALRESFVALRDIIDHLLNLPGCSYPLFKSVGDLATRHVLTNRFFRPFRSLEFRLEYDRVKSVTLLEALRLLPEGEREAFAVLTLSLFRLLHYLSYAQSRDYVGRLKVVLALVRSEAVSLIHFVTGQSHPFLQRTAQALREGLDPIIRDLIRTDLEGALIGAEQYRALFRNQLEELARHLRPSQPAVFADLIDPKQLGDRLRLDLWGFAGLCRAVEARLLAESPEGAESGFKALQDYIRYFHGVSYQLLRFGDIEAFDKFIGIISETTSVPTGPVARARLAEDCRLFSEGVQTIFDAVDGRTDLAGLPFNAEAARAQLSSLW